MGMMKKVNIGGGQGQCSKSDIKQNCVIVIDCTKNGHVEEDVHKKWPN